MSTVTITKIKTKTCIKCSADIKSTFLKEGKILYECNSYSCRQGFNTTQENICNEKTIITKVYDCDQQLLVKTLTDKLNNLEMLFKTYLEQVMYLPDSNSSVLQEAKEHFEKSGNGLKE